MSDVDPTPLTPVTLGDRLAWFRGDMVAGFAALSQQLATQHTALLAKLDDIADGTTLAQLRTAVEAGAASGGATEATVAAILSAIGTLASYPADYTVKELLALLNTHIAVEPGKAGAGLNLDTYGCTGPWDYSTRVTTMKSMGVITIEGVDYESFAPVVPIDYQYIVRDAVSEAASVPDSFFDTYENDNIGVCLSWNWEGMSIPPASVQLNGTDTILTWPVGVTVFDNRSFTGQYPWAFETYGYTVAYRFAVPVGDTLLPNVWWHFRHNTFTGS